VLEIAIHFPLAERHELRFDHQFCATIWVDDTHTHIYIISYRFNDSIDHFLQQEPARTANESTQEVLFKIAPAAKVGSTPLLGAVQAGHAAVASRWNAEVLPGMMQACWNE